MFIYWVAKWSVNRRKQRGRESRIKVERNNGRYEGYNEAVWKCGREGFGVGWVALSKRGSYRPNVAEPSQLSSQDGWSRFCQLGSDLYVLHGGPSPVIGSLEGLDCSHHIVWHCWHLVYRTHSQSAHLVDKRFNSIRFLLPKRPDTNQTLLQKKPLRRTKS